MDLNSDSEEDDAISPASEEQAGEVHDEDQWELHERHAPNAVRRSEHLELQQRVPCLGAPVGGTERAPTQNVPRASLARAMAAVVALCPSLPGRCWQRS